MHAGSQDQVSYSIGVDSTDSYIPQTDTCLKTLVAANFLLLGFVDLIA